MYQTPKCVVSVGVGTAAALLALTVSAGRTCEAQSGSCQTLYVRVAGSDGNDGCSPSKALASIAAAACDTVTPGFNLPTAVCPRNRLCWTSRANGCRYSYMRNGVHT